MAQVINTNYLSLVTQTNLNRSQGILGQAIERLSSGSRINSAKDDAAGQAIANRFTSNVKGLTQAARNASDGISITQTTEGALNEVNENIQRIRELTVQAQNGTNSESDIKSINEEVTARLDEIDRISAQTQFNGIKVLAEDHKMSFQVGAYDEERIDIDLKKVDRESLGLTKLDVSSRQFGDALTADDMFNLVKGDGSDDVAAKKAVADAIDGLKAGTDKVENATFHYVRNDDGTQDKTKVVISGTVKGKDVLLNAGLKTTAADAASTTKAAFSFDTPTEFSAADKKAFDEKAPLKTLDKALSVIDSQRSALGAIQNRMQSTINNLTTSVNNLSAARSRIQDADFATEVSNMSRGQILQQAGTAVLAQANQIPQTVLGLLR